MPVKLHVRILCQHNDYNHKLVIVNMCFTILVLSADSRCLFQFKISLFPGADFNFLFNVDVVDDIHKYTIEAKVIQLEDTPSATPGHVHLNPKLICDCQ